MFSRRLGKTVSALFTIAVFAIASAGCGPSPEPGTCLLAPTGELAAGSAVIWELDCALPEREARVPGDLVVVFPPLRDGNRIGTPPNVLTDENAPGFAAARVRRETVPGRAVSLAGTSGAVRFKAPPKGWKPGERVRVAIGRGPKDAPLAAVPTIATAAFAPAVLLDLGFSFADLTVLGAVDIKPGPAVRGEVLTPSSLETKQSFDAVVRFTDEYGNLAAPTQPVRVILKERADVGRDLSYNPPRSADVAGAYATVPGGSFDLPGYRWIEADFRDAFPTAMSNPIAVGDAGSGRQILFGEIDLATRQGEGADDPARALDVARDAQDLTFAATGDPAAGLGLEAWSTQKAACEAAERRGAFASLAGVRPNAVGTALVVFDDCRAPDPLPVGADPRPWWSRALSAAPIAAPNTPTPRWGARSWRPAEAGGAAVAPVVDGSGLAEPVTWDGSGPLSVALTPDAFADRPEGAPPAAQSAVQAMASDGRPVGVIGAGGALTALPAGALTRRTVFDAVKNGRSYATNGARILIYADVDGKPAGRRYAPGGKPVLHFEAAFSAPSATVELVKNGEVLYGEKFDENTWTANLTVPDEDFKDSAGYYWRVTQGDGGRAITSPFVLTHPRSAVASEMDAEAMGDAIEVRFEVAPGTGTRALALRRRTGDDGGRMPERYETIADGLPARAVFRDAPAAILGATTHYLLMEHGADGDRVVAYAAALTPYPARALEDGSRRLGGYCEDSGDTTVEVLGSTGAVLRRLELGLMESGPIEAVWDGRDEREDRVYGPAWYRVRCADGTGPLTPVIDMGAPPSVEVPGTPAPADPEADAEPATETEEAEAAPEPEAAPNTEQTPAPSPTPEPESDEPAIPPAEPTP